MESKSNFHIVTPFYRHQNRALLQKNLEGFIWHPIEGNFPNFGDQAYAKINHFIQTAEIIDDDYYQILNDDDALPADFIRTTREIGGDIVIFSLDRGQRTPPEAQGIHRHEAGKLIASRENMRIGGMGLQQIRFKGSLFKTLRCADHPFADGMIAQSLRDRDDIVFVPDVFILFNYLEPGRYDKNHSN